MLEIKKSVDTRPKKSIPELIARYRLEPQVRDLFVEGRHDATVIARFLRSLDLREVVVYEISTVDVPTDDVLTANLNDGNRGRVIYLAFELEKYLEPDSRAVTCIADRDYDLLRNQVYESPFLLFVEYSCMEMYAFEPGILDDMLAAVAPNLNKTGNEVLDELEPVLRRLFLIRAANIILKLNLRWLPTFHESCTITEKKIAFDEEDFIRRYLGKNAKLDDMAKFRDEITVLERLMEGDRRLFIRGHDFVDALSWYLREHASKSSPLHRREIVDVLVLTHIDRHKLQKSGFFKKLISRLSVERPV